jgi:hypothetical protein
MTPETRQKIFRIVLRSAAVHGGAIFPSERAALATDAAIRIEALLDGREDPSPARMPEEAMP